MAESETFYLKRGRRYVPYGANEVYGRDNGVTNGAWLIIVGNGSVELRRLVEPAHAEVAAAARTAQRAMLAALQAANRVKPNVRGDSRAMLEKRARAWAAYCAIMGDDEPVMFEGLSMHDLVDAGIAVLERAAREGNDGAE